jgi:hypothetical protein
MHLQTCGIQYVLCILAVCISDILTGDLHDEMLKAKIIDKLMYRVGDKYIGIAAACSFALAQFAKHGKRDLKTFLPNLIPSFRKFPAEDLHRKTYFFLYPDAREH